MLLPSSELSFKDNQVLDTITLSSQTAEQTGLCFPANPVKPCNTFTMGACPSDINPPLLLTQLLFAFSAVRK